MPGVIAAVTNREGIIYEGAFGFRLLGSNLPMKTDSVTWLASMSKALTATAAMQMVEQGRLQLDAPAAEIAPELGEAQVLLGFDAEGRPQMRPPNPPVTLRHLLTHTSGFAYELWSAALLEFKERTGAPSIFTCQNEALRIPLLFDPGEDWEYGIGIDWAGKMVEAVSCQRIGEYLERSLFEPVGMSSTAFKIRPDMRERLAKMHQRGASDRLEPLPDWEFPQQPEFDMGGGGLYSTAGDYLKWIRMLLNNGRSGGESILQPTTIEAMMQDRVGIDSVKKLKTVMPELTCDVDFYPGIPKGWGISFQINKERTPTGRPAGTLMWAGLCNSYYWVDQWNGLGGVYMTQMFPFADHRSLPLFYEFEAAVYRQIQAD